MKTIEVDAYGDAKTVSLHTDSTEPALKPGQLLIAARAASINPFDITLLSGALKDKISLSLPYSFGGDFSGVVEKIGPGVTGYAVGDAVYGSAAVVNGGSGSFAEKVAANAANTAKKPELLTFPDAASLPLVGTSAVQAIEEHIKISKDQKILIQGGAGGIGSLAIQIAKSHGAFVAATASGEGVPFTKALGADVVIDYRTERFQDRIKDYDAVFDTVGGETTNASLTALKKGGILVTMIGIPDDATAQALGVTAIRQGTKTSSENLARLAELINSGSIKPQVDKVFPIDEAALAINYFVTGHPKGKVVVNISG